MPNSQAHAPLWRHSFHLTASLGIKTVIMDRAGHMLAIANCGSHLPVEQPALLQTRWQELIHPDDLPRVLAYFAQDSAGGPISYRQMAASEGKMIGRVGVVTISKVWAGDAWLCYGDMCCQCANPGCALTPDDKGLLAGLVASAIESGPTDDGEDELDYQAALMAIREKLE